MGKANGMSSAAKSLAESLDAVGKGLLLVLTGAGVSVASGIPTFRGTDPGAIWKNDVTELGTFRYFQEDPVGSWSWYLSRFDRVLEAKPNAAHRALAALERWQLERGGSFLLVTQNVDTLHEDAGSQQMIKVHGTADRVRCPREGCSFASPRGSIPRSQVDLGAFLAEPTRDNLPRCPSCDSILRQHVLWFDEYYSEHQDYQWSRVQESAWNMSLALCIGTSFSVGVTELFLQHGRATGTPVLCIDPASAPERHPGLSLIAAKAEEVLPEVCRRLGA
jgi:NAD-dependent deacetylase